MIVKVKLTNRDSKLAFICIQRAKKISNILTHKLLHAFHSLDFFLIFLRFQFISFILKIIIDLKLAWCQLCLIFYTWKVLDHRWNELCEKYLAWGADFIEWISDELWIVFIIFSNTKNLEIKLVMFEVIHCSF